MPAHSDLVDAWLAVARSTPPRGRRPAGVGARRRRRLRAVRAVPAQRPRRDAACTPAARDVGVDRRPGLVPDLGRRAEARPQRAAPSREALDLAADDLDTATALLSARHIAGDAALTDELAGRARRAVGASGRSGGCAQLADRVERAPRAGRRGRVPARARPQGGPGRPARRALAALGRGGAQPVLLEHDDRAPRPALRRAARRARRAAPPHRPAEQRARARRSRTRVAEALGDADADDAHGATSPTAARSIAWTSDDAWRRVASSLRGPLGPRARREPRRSAPGVVARATARCTSTPTRPLEPTRCSCFACRGRGRPPTHRSSSAARSSGWRPTRRRCPTRGRPRRDDLLVDAAAARAAPPSRSSRRSTTAACGRASCPSGSRCGRGRSATPTTASPSTGTCSRRPPTPPALADRVERPDLLVVGALLHDLGKGYPGRPHRGRRRAASAAIGAAAGLPADDVDVLAELVAPPPAAARGGDPARPRRPGHDRAGRPERSASADRLSAARRADRSRLAGHRPGGVGPVEGGARAPAGRRVAARARRARPHRRA